MRLRDQRLTFSGDPPVSQYLIIRKKCPGNMSSRGPRGGEPEAGRKRPTSSSDALQVDSYGGRLATDRTRWHGASRALEKCWNGKCLLGVVALVIYGIMRLRLQIPFALLFATSATKRVLGQCPSYTEYSKVHTMNSCRCRYRRDVPRARMERRRMAH